MDQLPDQKDYPGAGALVVVDEATIEMVQHGDMIFSSLSRHMVVKIFNERGNKYANVLIPYDANSKVSDIQARTISPDGRSLFLEKNQIFDTNLYPESVFYSDLRAKRFTMPGVENGCVLEYRWEKTVDHFSFWSRWDFQQDEPVLLSKYTVRCPSHWNIPWKTYGVFVEPEVEKVMEGMKADHVWKLKNIPPFSPEIEMPPGNRTNMCILFAPVGVRSWDDVGCWFQQLAVERMKADPAVQSLTAKLVAGETDPKRKLQRIFEFVRDRIRYMAIEIGIGGYQPRFAGSVLKSRFGDCKDMVSLLVAMAECVGIRVDPVLLPTWHFGELDTAMVTQSQFNHLIARAVMPDSSEFWLDASQKECPFGDLPWYDQNRLVLVIARDGKTQILRTPRSSQNWIHRNWMVHVDSSGTADGSFHFCFFGAQAMEMRSQLKKRRNSDIQKWLDRDMLALFPSIQIDQLNIQNIDALDDPLEISGHFENAFFIDPKPNGFLFQPASMAPQEWNSLFPETDRKYPVEFEYPLETVHSIEIRYPENWAIQMTQQKDSLSTKKAQCYYQWEKTGGNEFSFHRIFRLDSTKIDRSEYGDFRTFLNQVASKDKNGIIFIPKAFLSNNQPNSPNP